MLPRYYRISQSGSLRESRSCLHVGSVENRRTEAGARRQRGALKGKCVSLKLFKKNLNNEAILWDINGPLASLKNRFSKSELYFTAPVSYLLLPQCDRSDSFMASHCSVSGPTCGEEKDSSKSDLKSLRVLIKNFEQLKHWINGSCVLTKGNETLLPGVFVSGWWIFVYWCLFFYLHGFGCRQVTAYPLSLTDYYEVETFELLRFIEIAGFLMCLLLGIHIASWLVVGIQQLGLPIFLTYFPHF